MSSRIAVMFAGEILQIGAPDEVYDDPNHLKVARFISNPGLNTLPFGAVANTAWGRQIGSLINGGARDCTVGFRPEACTIATSREHSDLDGRLVFCERFGAEAFAHIASDQAETPIIARVEPAAAARLHADQLVRLRFDADKIFLFDANGSRMRIRARAVA